MELYNLSFFDELITDTSIAGDRPESEDEDYGDTSALICGRCYADVDELFPSGCAEKPEDLIGLPIGQYHCPDCGAMVLVGVPHPRVCKRCSDDFRKTSDD